MANFSVRTVLYALIGVLTCHLTVMIFYIDTNRAGQVAAHQQHLLQRLSSAFTLLQSTPPEMRAKAVMALANSEFNVSVTEKPKWPKQVTNIDYWLIRQAVHRQGDNVALSIQLESGQWLNVQANAYTHFVFSQLLMIGLELVLFGSLLIAAWSINRFVQPLKEFKAAAERLGIDLQASPIETQGPVVVREAAEAMNQMQKRIRDLIQDRTQMLAAISHDLRTPITRLKIRAQLLEDAELGQSFSADLNEMEKMISEVLAFAREDSGSEQLKQLDIVSLLEALCDTERDAGHDIAFHANCQRIGVLGRSLALKRAFSNLIHNALRYARRVEVSVVSADNKVTVSIRDDGPGIAPHDLPNVFRPFYRGENSRSRHTGGVGLGLAVVHDIIKSHGGKIALQNLTPHGLEVFVTLKP